MNFVTRAQAIARMKNGDLPTRAGGYSSALHFSDGTRTTGPVGHRMKKDGIVEPPHGSACDTPYTLTEKGGAK